MKELSNQAERTVGKSLMEVMLWLKRRKVT